MSRLIRKRHLFIFQSLSLSPRVIYLRLCNQRSQYLSGNFSSLIDRFGDFRCDIFSKADKIQSIIYVGGVVFIILIGIVVAQRTTKRKVLMICLAIYIISLIVTTLSVSLEMMAVGLFYNYGTQCVFIFLIPIYFMEIV